MSEITSTRAEKFASFLPWLVCFTAALFFFYEFIQMNMFNAIDASITRAFQLNASQLGKLSATYFYANIAFLFIAGTILDRISTRKIILLTLGICALGTLAFALSPHVWVAAICRFLTGIGSAFCFLSCVRLASRWFPSQRLALVIGLIVTMAMLGGVVAQTPLTLLVKHYGWRHALIIDSTAGFLIMALIWMIVRDYPKTHDINFQQQQQELQTMGAWKAWRHAFLNHQNWLAGIYACTMNLPIALLGGIWGAPFLTKVHHFTLTESSYVTSMLFFGTIIGSPLAGLLSDRICRRRAPMIFGAIFSLVVFYIMVHLHQPSVATLMVFFFLLGLITSTQVLSYPAVAEKNPPMLTATSVSVVSICVISGFGIFQPIFGWLIDLHWSGAMLHGVPFYTAHDFVWAMLIIPIGFIVSLITSVLFKESYCREPKNNTIAN